MAARFWVTTGTTGGTGNWSNTQNWSATSGGAAGASVPGSADTATFNASSGAGTATIDSNVTIQTLTMTGFTGTLAFGTNTLSLNSTGTVYTGATTFSVTGTPIINVTSAGSTAITVASTAATEANSISFNFTGGTYTLTYSGTAKNVDFTGFGGAFLLGAASTIYGNWNVPSGSSMTFSASAVTLTFGATSGTKTIYTNAKPMDFPVDFNGVGGTFQLTSNIVIGSSSTVSTRQARLFGGTLDLNNFSLISGIWSGGASNVRVLAFGSSGNITVIGSGSNVLNASATAANNFSFTGTSLIKISNNSATAATIATGNPTEVVSMNYAVTTGTYAITMFAGTSGVRNLDFTGFSGTFATAWSTVNIFGNLTMASTAGATLGSISAITFGATSGVQVLTTNTKVIDQPITFNGANGTFQLADALTMGGTRLLTLTNGTLDLNGKTLTALTITIAAGTKNITFNGGTLLLTNSGSNVFNNANPTGFNTTQGSSLGSISMNNAAAKQFTGGGSTYNCALTNSGAGAINTLGNNTFTTIQNTVSPSAFNFGVASTTTVTNFLVNGTAGNLVTLNASNSNVSTLVKAGGGVVSCDYLSIIFSTATPGTTWYAGTHSTNVSNNSGWIFTAPPVTANGNFLLLF
jgi:hypothetical protein